MKTWAPFPLRPQQGPAAEALLQHQDGIYESPAGSGKTVAALEMIRRARQRHNIVIVHQIDIAEQWKEEAEWSLPGFPVGIIGEGRWEEARLTVATVQTLYSRLAELDRADWWTKWGLMVLDECHHQTAETFMEVVQRFCSYWRVGLSATPDKTGIFAMALAVLGDIVARTTRHQLRDFGILARPTVHVVPTAFSFQYWPTHTTSALEHCQVPDCKKSKKKRHFHRNNYSTLLKHLTEADERNQVIGLRAANDYKAGKRVLVDSTRIKQLKEIERWIKVWEPMAEIWWMTGSEDSAQRRFIRQQFKHHPGILLSTIAREAVNIPRMDTVHLTFPIRNPGTIRQIIGRVERAAPGKEDPVVHDYYDQHVGVLANQFRGRRRDVYMEERYKVYWGEDEVEDF